MKARSETAAPPQYWRTTMADWSCARCGAPDGRNRRSACCRACIAWMDAHGMGWCGLCQSEQPRLDDRSRGRCRKCRTKAEYAQRRGRRLEPPPQTPQRAGGAAEQILRAWAMLAAPEWPSSLGS